MRISSGKVTYSPSDLIIYIQSPFASWMDHYFLLNPSIVKPDVDSDSEKLFAQIGNEFELTILDQFKTSGKGLIEIPKQSLEAVNVTCSAIEAQSPIIYQAALDDGKFAGIADFVILDDSGQYQVWDTKLAHSVKPYFIIQLCCYCELLAHVTKKELPKKFGIILGTSEKVELNTEDFIHYYYQVKNKFLDLHENFTNNISECPEPQPNASYGRWKSYAENFFIENDHLKKVAGITIGQIKKLKASGIQTMADLASTSITSIPKLASDSLLILKSQALLQIQTQSERAKTSNAKPLFQVLPSLSPNGEPTGLSLIPPQHAADVFFDIEGYPLTPGGLEYLFGAYSFDQETQSYAFWDWWAHDRDQEKIAFESFVDWAYYRWIKNPEMHIYHYASYEVNAIKRLSTRHDSRQDEVDSLLRANVFIDIYKIVRHGLRVGETSYSIKSIEHLYRGQRDTNVTNAVDSIVQYTNWKKSQERPSWKESDMLKAIRDYNEDDCKSTFELLNCLREIASMHGIAYTPQYSGRSENAIATKELRPEVVLRMETINKLRDQTDSLSPILADLIDFHRREEKPLWWRMFDRTQATADELKDDPSSLEGVQAVGNSRIEKQSLIQKYIFDPAQECKLAADGKTTLMFNHDINVKFNLESIDINEGFLELKISKTTLNDKMNGKFPTIGSLIQFEYVQAKVIQTALTEIALKHISKQLHSPIYALLQRTIPASIPQNSSVSVIDTAKKITKSMSGECLIIQGPPGTGKTYTAAQMIVSLLLDGKKIGVTSNSHKAIINLLLACGDTTKKMGVGFIGVKVGGNNQDDLFKNNPDLKYIKSNKDAKGKYQGGIVGGTAWLFTLPEWENAIDFLFIDEAGQVSLANAVAMARSAKNIILLGDQMQLEQPIQGTHPGDAALSSLQYCLKNLAISKPDSPAFHAVVPDNRGLFLGESRRMHPLVCNFISESVYEGRLSSFLDCANQKISIPADSNMINKENGIVFVGVEHDGNVQQSDEEVEKINEIYHELLGSNFTSSEGTTKSITLEDFLFIAPYNAQVRALQARLPKNARIGSVDKFQGQEAPICIMSLCSSVGEYGSRGLSFILDRNRLNVGISRAQCLAIVVGDPRIANSTTNSIKEMALLNLFCKISTQ